MMVLGRWSRQRVSRIGGANPHGWPRNVPHEDGRTHPTRLGGRSVAKGRDLGVPTGIRRPSAAMGDDCQLREGCSEAGRGRIRVGQDWTAGEEAEEQDERKRE